MEAIKKLGNKPEIRNITNINNTVNDTRLVRQRQVFRKVLLSNMERIKSARERVVLLNSIIPNLYDKQLRLFAINLQTANLMIIDRDSRE